MLLSAKKSFHIYTRIHVFILSSITIFQDFYFYLRRNSLAFPVFVIFLFLKNNFHLMYHDLFCGYQAVKFAQIARLKNLFHSSGFPESVGTLIFTARKRSLGQRNIFTVHRCLSVPRDEGVSLKTSPYGKERVVRILLECILVLYYFMVFTSTSTSTKCYGFFFVARFSEKANILETDKIWHHQSLLDLDTITKLLFSPSGGLSFLPLQNLN